MKDQGRTLPAVALRVSQALERARAGCSGVVLECVPSGAARKATERLKVPTIGIGAHSFVGGCSRIAKDVPPYLKAVGNPVKLYGLNSVGLQRRGFAEETVRELKRAYRLLFRSELNVSQALERARAELQQTPEVVHFLEFIEQSDRGVGF
jgi:hypothetical protein